MKGAIWVGALALLGEGCATQPPSTSPPDQPRPAPSADAAAPTLDEIVAHQAVTFDPGTLPPSLVELMAKQRVVMLGEHHGYREHHDLLLDMAKALHGRGARWVLFEGFQAESWSADAYVNGALDSLSPPTRKYFGYTLDGLRAFNRDLPADERLHVAFVDIDHRAWAFPSALARMLEDLGGSPCLEGFLAEAPWDRARSFEAAQTAFDKAFTAAPDAYYHRLEAFAARLREGSCFSAPHGQAALPATLTEMAEVALESLRIRAVWDKEGEDAAHPAREDAIKAMVDRRLSAAKGTVILNMGGFHLQKTHVMGTPKAWVGEHLASASHPAGGAVLRLYVQFARAEREADGAAAWWSLEEEAPPGELLATLHRHADGKAAFLPVSDDWFQREVMPVSYMYQVVEHAPGAVFDGYVLLPEGHKLY